jgi:hypothetical protein
VTVLNAMLRAFNPGKKRKERKKKEKRYNNSSKI